MFIFYILTKLYDLHKALLGWAILGGMQKWRVGGKMNTLFVEVRIVTLRGRVSPALHTKVLR